MRSPVLLVLLAVALWFALVGYRSALLAGPSSTLTQLGGAVSPELLSFHRGAGK